MYIYVYIIYTMYIYLYLYTNLYIYIYIYIFFFFSFEIIVARLLVSRDCEKLFLAMAIFVPRIDKSDYGISL